MTKRVVGKRYRQVVDRSWWVWLGGLLLVLAGCAPKVELAPAVVTTPTTNLEAELSALLQQAGVTALVPPTERNTAQIALGRALFFDPELSGNRDIACATCHHPALNSGDNLSLSLGTGATGLGTDRELGYGRNIIPRNAPELFNRGGAEWHSFFWDGRVAGSPEEGFTTPAGDQLPAGLTSALAAQAMFPVTSRDEMRGAQGDLDINGQPNELAEMADDDLVSIWNGIMTRLLTIPEYVELFQAAYPDISVEELGFQHAANAMAAFEVDAFTLLDSPWDRYLAGDEDALSGAAMRGAILFYGQAGCSRCHAGSLMTDQQFHNIGVPQLGPGKVDKEIDTGRFLETGADHDKFAFRTPPLRNVALTGPWMHNGAYINLVDVIHHHMSPTESLLNYDPSPLNALIPNARTDDVATKMEVLSTLDPLMQTRLELTDGQVEDLLAFLNALTSPTALNLRNSVPPTVPSGLRVDG